MADIYHGNFSLFQSLPDVWAIDQIHPIAPLQKHNKRPNRRVILNDITCDSDGIINKFVLKDGFQTHYLCMTLVMMRTIFRRVLYWCLSRNVGRSS